MIGSHNTLSYLPPKNLWGKITRLWNKCQDKTLEEQYRDGVEYFDIRINLYINSDNDYEWHFVHNKVDYGKVSNYVWNWFGNNKCPIRIIFDQRSKPNYVNKRIEIFKDYIALIRRDFKVNIDSAITYWDWKEYCKHYIEVKEFHASVKAKWYQYLLGCKWFANRYNDFGKAVNMDTIECINEVLLLDYI